MGSSKSGSLDKFAAFSPAAALASGKVKLPDTGIIGMMQADAENNKVMKENNLANQMAYQNQQDEQQKYMQMMQQQMVPGMNMGGQVDSMKFLKQHLPYQDGGHVALRRKMFKMGGDVNTHGVGITSGLSYNQGGSVRQGYGKGDIVTKLGPKLAKKLKEYIFGSKGPKPSGREIDKYIDTAKPDILRRTYDKIRHPIRYTMGDPSKISTNPYVRFGGRALRGADVATTGALIAGIPGAAHALFGERGGYADPRSEAKGSGTERVLRGLSNLSQTALDVSGPGFLYEGLNYLGTDPDAEGPVYDNLSDYLSGDPSGTNLPKGSGENIGVDPNAFMEAANQAQEDAMEERIQKYMSYLSGEEEEPDTMLGKFFAAEGLGDALVAGGSALMEGEGYGAAARAFNEPLSAARRGETEEERANRAAAANLVLSEDMQIAAEDRALANELLAGGDIDTAQQAELYKLARRAGVTQLVPTEENDDTQIDAVKLTSRAGVYADPRGLNPQGTLLVAVNSEGGVEYTNDPQAAKEFAAS